MADLPRLEVPVRIAVAADNYSGQKSVQTILRNAIQKESRPDPAGVPHQRFTLRNRNPAFTKGLMPPGPEDIAKQRPTLL